MYFLDTNTLIYFFKGMGNVANILFTKSMDEVFIPSIALYELEVGIMKSMNPAKRKKQLEILTSTVHIAELGYQEAKAAACIRADLETRGEPIGPCDTLISGIVLANQGVLVTHNMKEFNRVKGLLVEDWY